MRLTVDGWTVHCGWDWKVCTILSTSLHG